MNEQHTIEDNPLAEEIFVFSPSRGIRLNIDAQQLPQQNDATSRFELIANNPLIKTNKNNNLSEYDYYIEDPSNLEIKNELINDIVFSAGRCCLKKNAVDILYCAFDVFSEEKRFDLKDNSSLNFYINILLMYPPELKHNSLLQYFSILHKILENNDITLDYKYLVTNRALEIEWEKCNFVKYNHFKAFFSSMKKFFKVSPLFTEEPFIEENTTNIYQDLLKRTLAGRALAIIQYIVDCDDQLKLLMLFKAIEWLQKLESLKMLLNLNLNFIFNRSKDKVASDLLKQMYGRSTMAFNLQGAEKVPSPIPITRYEESLGLKAASNLVSKIGAGVGGSSSDQIFPPQQAVERRGSESRGDQSFELSTKPKLAPTKSSDQESSNMDRIRRTDSNSSRRGMLRESIKEDSLPEVLAGSQLQAGSNKMSGQAKTQNKMNLFFDLINAAKYQEDYAGRISNFLKKASKLGYEYVESEKDKIDSIIMKFKNNYTIDQINDLIRNYKKFCGDYQILVNYQLIHALESVKASQTTPISKPRQDSERSKSPPRTTNLSALKMLKTNSEKFPTGLQTNLAAAAASNHSSKDSQQSNIKGLGDDAADSNKLSVIKKDLERRSREKEGQEELKSSSTSALDLHKSKQEKKKIDWPNSRTFGPGVEQASSRGYFERTNRNSDE